MALRKRHLVVAITSVFCVGFFVLGIEVLESDDWRGWLAIAASFFVCALASRFSALARRLTPPDA
jgi:hypothetical protein